ncbi:MAG TPA: MFS transporter, partial [Telluria sp.]|nr:MFS transporter [Telluria sp.]
MKTTNPWLWVPSLYFGQGIPYAVVMTLSVIMYKNTGVSNTDIALYTSWLYLPWVIKPLWSPLVDMFRTKRFFIVSLQFVMGAALALVALTLKMPAFFQMSIAVFWLMAFASATHDIAADGFYMLGMPGKQQAAFVGVRSVFWRVAQITAQGGVVWMAGTLGEQLADVRLAWSIVLFALGVLFVLLFAWHQFVLPRPEEDRAVGGSDHVAEFFRTFSSFFAKRDIWLILGFILSFRLGEAQLVKLVAPFLLDPVDKGGLGLTTADVGIAYGTVGMLALVAGGLLGGVYIARIGLKRALWPMVFGMHLPDLVFVYLATAQPQHLTTVSAFIAIEQFGYGFGFTSLMLYMMMVAQGEHKTAHYAICTGFMALGMMLPGMWSGWLQDHIGYPHFFTWVILATIPSFLVVLALPL